MHTALGAEAAPTATAAAQAFPTATDEALSTGDAQRVAPAAAAVAPAQRAARPVEQMR